METLGVIDASTRWDGEMVGPMDRLANVPLILWAAHKLAVACGGKERIAVIDPDHRSDDLLQRHNIRTVPAHSIDKHQTLVVDWSMPFVTVEDYRAARVTGQINVPDGIQGMCVINAGSLEIAQAIARGLPPDDPRVAGVRRFALPTDTDFRAVVTDVDGCLTDATVYRAESGEAMRAFNTKDGIGHRKLQAAGIRIGWLSTAMECKSILDRARSLDVDEVDAGTGHKGPRFENLCAKLGVAPEQVIFLGDDIHDLPAMRLAGAMACPADAHPVVRAAVDCVLSIPGGRGAFRELADLLTAGINESHLNI